MEIDARSPCSGTVTAGGRTERFAGWLGMLQVLADLLETTTGDLEARDAGRKTSDADDT